MAPRSDRKHQQRDIVVIGASAGGIAALRELVQMLPHDFPAPIFVVQHVAPDSSNSLARLLDAVAPLPVKQPHNGETVEPGTIYIAPADRHMLVENDRILITHGPKENKFRPSIDALFRSVAYSYGPRVIGVVLTGYLDDGTSGLWTVQRLGGVTVVQDPDDAVTPAMPINALQFVKADYVVPLAELAALLVRLTLEPAPRARRRAAAELELLQLELAIAKQDNAFEMGIIDKGRLTPFTCPECHGALTQLIEGNIIRYRCHTGHAYTISTLLSEAADSVEAMLYQSMRGLEETKMLLQTLGNHFKQNGRPAAAATFFRKAEKTGAQARVVHDSILKHEALSGDLRFQSREDDEADSKAG
ncbi:chemotaxis protein CheB [Hymenobacter sp. CRA2]|uniref:chemotaxis protein CheB n=1 Tax=Hymenobacter sp. CRA2 TaxID=1955620 RepID=UPI00098F168A|nr:chemotaxis protein CheB [Hymenobacter sp. CRA2]OON71111.1 chemotaxis protein CheB [Hymenobacter sp. CRA2]